MADTKISALPSATTPVAGTEVVPIVQGGVTKKLPLSAIKGTVLQVVTSTTSTKVDSTSSTFADTGLSASITPISTSNKVLVFATISGIFNNGAATTGTMLRLLRGAAEIVVMENVAAYSPDAVGTGSSSTQYLDSPASTSSVTYKVQFANRNAAGQVSVQFDGNSTSSIVLMEIAA